MRHGSLFSGIGGFDLAAEWMGWENVFHCEWNDFGQRVLKYYWPNADSFTDITKSDFKKYHGTIDILTGGFPCQPYSAAGKRRGKEDDRHLWPEMLRAIREISPRFVVGENVRGLTNWNGGMVFDEVCSELESIGYQVAPVIIPACGVNAPHKRERIWFIANLHKISGRELGKFKKEDISQRNQKIRSENRKFFQLVFDGNTPAEQWSRGSKINAESPMVCDSHGISFELDGTTFSKWAQQSNEAYGNAIVPQIAYQIFKAINQSI